MKYYPVNLNIRDRKCLVVGGGTVGTRKVATLVTCGAKVTVVSPVISSALSDLAAKGVIRVYQREFCPSDLNDIFLVIGATSNEELNRRISEDAEQRNLLCNIADVPKACNFILPAVIARGDLIIAISTSGNSPAFAKKLREKLENQFGEEYGYLLHLMGAVRKKLLAHKHEPEAHKHLFENILDAGLLDMIREERIEDINALLLKTFGKGYTLEELLPEQKK
ncbi:MAG: bifunctional precorrin-2 dehydrogenase/sirohydrochlorin ferrochelatase [Desulfobacteraceae bacterium]|nr:MAG: bifunctional precorrin-2 dehydrogenase/sirohydrochlorin ferrochelatase [Desulfobacteraceae bacterium]